jgi:hypothetical protein
MEKVRASHEITHDDNVEKSLVLWGFSIYERL